MTPLPSSSLTGKASGRDQMPRATSIRGSVENCISISPWIQNNRATSQPLSSLPVSRLRALLRDFTDLLGQQMFLWGRDVVHARGNLLCEYGFEKRKSEGLEGTSCYRKDLGKEAFVELHGACAGHYDLRRKSPHNFLYIRNKKHCFLYSGDKPPAPGFYASHTLRNGRAIELYNASLKFLDWWLAYEDWIDETTATGWREKGYAAFASLPASRPILAPQEALAWLRQYREDPVKIVRVSEWMKSRRP